MPSGLRVNWTEEASASRSRSRDQPAAEDTQVADGGKAQSHDQQYPTTIIATA